ncbi:MAG: hypothetical protein J6K13_04070 [Clostridia bacterium]|nr:hypothetical protein [Clostridia bacterium]
MFGYVRANVADLTEEEKIRYRAFYCGLCRALGERHGQAGRMALTYDMTFLAMFLSSLYEPEETAGEMRCVTHPAKPHAYVCTEVSDYAADMTIALTYHKCMDDWQDEHKASRKAYADLLRKPYETVKARWPRQTECIEACMRELSEVEGRREASPDAGANCFGKLMAELFVMKEDYWRSALRAFGMSLGRYIYLVDAACDYDDDRKSGSYNPVILMDKQLEDMRDYLMQALGQASAAFEALPMVQNDTILKNILYSGIWQSYNEMIEKRKDGNKRG